MRRRDIAKIVLTSAAGSALTREAAARAQRVRGADPYYPLTTAEQSAGVRPLNYAVPAPRPERYGAVGDGKANDQSALQRCLSVNNGIELGAGRSYLINGLTLNRAYATIRGSAGAVLVIADGPGNFGLRFVSPSGNRVHFDTGFVGRDFMIACQPGRAKITGIHADNAEIVLLDNVIVLLAGNSYQGSAVGDGSIAFFGFFQQDGVFVKCTFTGGGGTYADGVHLAGNLAANETPNNNYFLGCRAQSCGGYGVRVRLGDGNIWRGGKIQANSEGGWVEGDDGFGNGPSNTVIADMGFEANKNNDLTLNTCSRTRVHDCTFQSTSATYHVYEAKYATQGLFHRNMSFAGKPVWFAGNGTENVWDYNNGFGAVTANETTFAIDSYQIVELKWNSAIATDCSKGYHFVVTVTQRGDISIANPTNPRLGQLYTWDILNSSGDAMGAIRFGNEFLTQGALVAPANAKRRTITFRRIHDRYVEIARTAADVS